MTTLDPGMAEKVHALELRVVDLERQVADLIDPLRPRVPTIPETDFNGNCMICGNEHGGLMCPQASPTAPGKQP